MAPEYESISKRIFVPEEVHDAFLSQISTIPGVVVTEFPQTQEQNVPLIDDVRTVLKTIPTSTVGQLLSVSYSFSDHQAPKAWRDVIEQFTPSDRSRVTRAFRGLARVGYNDVSVESLQEVDFDNIRLPSSVGKKSRELLKQIFSEQDTQNPPE